MVKKLVFIAIIISFSVCKSRVGFISNVEGHVEILTDEAQKTVLNAVPGRYVYEGDIIRSYKESFCTIVFIDQTAFFTIGSYSEVKLYNEDLGLKKTNLSYGNLYFENKSKIIPFLIFTKSSQVESKNSAAFLKTNIEGDDSIYSINSSINLYNKKSNLSITIPNQEKASSYKDGVIELSNSEENFMPKNIKKTVSKTQLDLKIPAKEIIPQKGDLIPAYSTERDLNIYTPLKQSPFSISANSALSSINNNPYIIFSLNTSYKRKESGISIILDYYLKAQDSPEINLWDSEDRVLAKIKKITYRNKSNSINIQAGNINKISFGHGLLVRRFSNKYHYPFINRFGASLEYNNRDFISTKLFVSDLERLSDNSSIAGLHSSLFISKYIPLKMGIGLVADMNQFSEATTYSLDRREINGLEFDFTYDFYTKKGYDINLISEIAATLFSDRHYYKRYDSDELGSGLKNKSGTWGAAVGVEGAYSDFVNFKSLIHYNDPLFMVSFFNDTYELERLRCIEKLDAYSDGIEQIENMFSDYEIDAEGGVFVPKDLYGSYLQNELVYSSVGFSLDASYNYYNKILGYIYFSTFFEVGSPNETNSFSSINLNIEIMDKVIKNISNMKFYLSRNYANKLFDFISDYNENTIIGLSLDAKIKKNMIVNFSFNRLSYDYDLDFDTDRSDNISIGFTYNFI